jgi:MHS family proline/betaine transporter-like MFS transporter
MQYFMSISEQKSLTKEQKEAVGLLSIGTFLEYFDVMLYVHMAVLLNELFFPKTDPFTASLLSAFAFCSTYFFRPFGALLFGYIGDSIGRKHTVIITTFFMFLSCLIMANLPTYAEIGIIASWCMLGCRMLQGISSMGEVVGALIYLTELIPLPTRHRIVPIIPLVAALGGFGALAVASLINLMGISWRVCFWLGCFIAIIGVISRTALRETPEFVDAAKRIKKIGGNLTLFKQYKKQNKSIMALFCLECMWPLCFYFSFIYCGDILKNNFNYSSVEVINQNFIVGFFTIIGCSVRVILSQRIHPLIILKYTLIISTIIFILCPIILINIYSPYAIGLVQVLVVLFAADVKFAASSIYSHFPVLQRFKATSLLYALSRTITYVITSFGLIYIIDIIGNFGITLIMLIGSIASGYGLSHFLALEKKAEVTDLS